MIIFIFFLIIILILIICSIVINLCSDKKYTNNKKTHYSEGGGYKEDFEELSNNLNTIYKKIEYRKSNEITSEDISAQKTRTTTINDIIRENKKNIDYYEVKSRKEAPPKKISLDELENLLDIGNVPEGRFFLKNGKIINT
jgi:flagellar basal body-associated protein FliL